MARRRPRRWPFPAVASDDAVRQLKPRFQLGTPPRLITSSAHKPACAGGRPAQAGFPCVFSPFYAAALVVNEQDDHATPRVRLVLSSHFRRLGPLAARGRPCVRSRGLWAIAGGLEAAPGASSSVLVVLGMSALGSAGLGAHSVSVCTGWFWSHLQNSWVAAQLSPPILRVNTPLFWISTACSGPEGPAARQEAENKGIDGVFHRASRHR